MNFLQVGSPLAARQNPLVYMVIVYLVIILAIILGIWIYVKLLEKKHSTPEWIEAQKSKPTAYKDVQKLAKRIELNKDETALLWKICKDNNAPNIYYTYSDDDFVDKLFKAGFRQMAQMRVSDKELYDLFRLRFHIYKSVSYSGTITSSTNIPVGSILSYPAPSSFQYQFTLVKNDKNGLFLSIPEALEETSEDRPNKLDKIALIFSLPNKQQFALVTRVVQYLEQPNGEKQLLLTHSNTICPQSRRTSRRFSVNRECKFSAVDVSTNAKGELSFKPKENKYDGTVVDLSEGGCKMYTTLPIKQKQYLYMEFEVLGKTEGFYGQIANTRTDLDTGMYSLHIGFKLTPLETKVKILTDLYDWS
ncbi:MAG: PilZ domain-containing protein [Treponema sp.]|nr:PilZ domain-containing protein [Candidatus Treponema scatequi]